jgi:predicted PurR-regulated permease PerM
LDVSAAWVWRLLLLAVGAVVLAIVVIELRLVVVPLIVSVFVAAALMPVLARLTALGVPRTAAALVVLAAALAILAGVVALIVPNVAEQVPDLRRTVEQGAADVDRWVDDRFGIDLREATGRIFGGDGVRLGPRILSGAILVAEVLAGLLLTVALSFFALRDGERFAAASLRAVPEDRREVAAAAGRRSWAVIGGYLRGVVVVGLVDAAAIGIGLALIGVPLVFSLMVLTFLGAFFPLVGAVVAGIVAVLVALVSGGVTDALLTLAVVVAVQQIEGDVVAPLVYGRTLSLHPAVILLALTAGGVVAGIAGAAFAVPLAAVVKVAIDEVRGGPGSSLDATPAAATGDASPDVPG